MCGVGVSASVGVVVVGVSVSVFLCLCVVWMGVDDGWLLPLVSALSLFPAAAVLPFCVTHSPRESESERE